MMMHRHIDRSHDWNDPTPVNCNCCFIKIRNIIVVTMKSYQLCIIKSVLFWMAAILTLQ